MLGFFDCCSGATCHAPTRDGSTVAAARVDFDAQALLVNWLRRLVGFSLVAFLLVLLIPAMPKALAIATEAPPWARIGMGLAVAVILPLLGVLLFATGFRSACGGWASFCWRCTLCC